MIKLILPWLKFFTPRKLKYSALSLFCLTVIFLSLIRAFDFFELVTLDWRFRLRPAQPVSSRIVMVDISEDSLNTIGRWPFDREYHAVLITALAKAGARAIVFDVIFSEESPSDEKLIAATKQAGSVFYPQVYRLKQGTESREIIAPLLPGLKENCLGYGHINIVPDIDGKVRRVPLFVRYKEEQIPQLSLRVALNYLDISPAEIKIDKHFIRLGEKINIPVDRQGFTLINYAAGWGRAFKHYSYLDIVRSYVQADNGLPPLLDLTVFKDKICFIGLTATGTHDLRPTPLETNYPMVGIHGQIINSIFQNSFLRRLNKWANLFLLILSAAAVLVILKKYPAAVSFLLYLGLVCVGTAAAVLIFIFFGWWIDLFYPLLVINVIYLGGIFYHYLLEIKKRLLVSKELSLAAGIQMSFLPTAAPKFDKLDLGVRLVTAKGVGGDLYDFVREGSKAGVFLGDVSGKGMPAALFMVMVIAGFRAFNDLAAQPAALLEKLNAYLLSQSQSGLFVTAVYLLYDLETGRLEFSSGGHLPPILFKKKTAEFAPLVCEGGSIVGIMEGIEFGQASVLLEPGDVILIYTDGVTETRNKKGEEYGEARLIKALDNCKDLTAPGIAEFIYKRINTFSQGLPAYDDITIIALKIPEK